MAADPSTNSFRPLLRLEGQGAVNTEQLVACGYGGVIHSTSEFQPTLAAHIKDAGLQNWLDISDLSPTEKSELRPWELHFDDLEAHPKPGRQTSSDPHNPETSGWIIAELERLTLDSVDGILYDPHPSMKDAEELPAFPWSHGMAERFPMNDPGALVANTGKQAARVRQEYWQALAALREGNITALASWCEQKGFGFAPRHHAPEWDSLRLSPVLQTRLDANHEPSWPGFIQSARPASMLYEAYSRLHAGVQRFCLPVTEYAFGDPGRLVNLALIKAVAPLVKAHRQPRVGLLFPGRSAQTHYHPDGHRFTRWISEDLHLIADLLDDLHFDWVFVHEGRLLPEEYRIELLVIPGVTALGTDTWRQVESFVENGGKVACLGLLPRWNETGRDKVFEERVGKATLVTIDDLYEAYAAYEDGDTLPPTIGYPVFREHYSGGRLCCYQPRLNEDSEDARLRVHQILHESLTSDFETQGRRVRYSHYHVGERDIFWVFNSGNETQRVNARMRPSYTGRKPKLEVTDPTTGEKHMAAVWMAHPRDQGGGISLALALAPGEARWIDISRNETAHTIPNIESTTFEVQSFDGSTLKGYASESGQQKAALRSKGKVEWVEADFVTVPAPLLLDDDWEEVETASLVEYSQNVTLPDEWSGCRIFLEVAGDVSVVEAIIDGASVGSKISPPMRFDITQVIGGDAVNGTHQLTLKAGGESEEAPLVRLVAYPMLELNLSTERVEASHE